MSSINSKEYRELIKRLIEVRKAIGMTQLQVAEQIGKPQSFVSKVESRERRVDVIELMQFAKVYKISITDLLNI